MTENYESAIETSPAYCNTEKNIIYISSSSSSSSEKDEDNGSPIRHIRCVKRYEDVKLFEETDDCFILDFDPSNPLQFSNLTLSAFDNSPSDTTTDLVLIAEKGQVACRDYPHPRHLCLKHPFETTSHESFCELVNHVFVTSAIQMLHVSFGRSRNQLIVMHLSTTKIGNPKGIV